MKKIPTLFVRDDNDRRHVTRQVTPGCEWVLAGEGVPTRKYDGTCVLVRRDGLAIHTYARREIKPGKPTPAGYIPVDYDPTTGKTVGWEPAAQSGFAAYIAEAIEANPAITPGTYELVGPNIQCNPEHFAHHLLVPHGQDVLDDVPLDVDELRAYVKRLPYEGIVWHHPDGRMAKLKARDIPDVTP